MKKIEQKLKEAAYDLLKSNQVSLVIGYGKGPVENTRIPIFIRDEKQCENIVFDEYCVHNLALYLTREPGTTNENIAIIAKGCDIRAIVVLQQENKISRNNLVVIGVACNGVYYENKNTSATTPVKCTKCKVKNPINADIVIGSVTDDTPQTEIDETITISEMPDHDRWLFWKNEFSKCIKCYACRSICPLCYCSRCFVDRAQPAWTSPIPHSLGNLSYHIVRAMHLTGRCISCEECQRVCPMNIPIMLLNRKMAQKVEEFYDYTPGEDPTLKPPLSTYNENDPEDFIQ